jgi:hypothetical protein
MLGLPPSQISLLMNSEASASVETAKKVKSELKELTNPEKDEEPKKAVHKSDKKVVVEKKGEKETKP